MALSLHVSTSGEMSPTTQVSYTTVLNASLSSERTSAQQKYTLYNGMD